LVSGDDEATSAGGAAAAARLPLRAGTGVIGVRAAVAGARLLGAAVAIAIGPFELIASQQATAAALLPATSSAAHFCRGVGVALAFAKTRSSSSAASDVGGAASAGGDAARAGGAGPWRNRPSALRACASNGWDAP
jgi:hypothetical protein